MSSPASTSLLFLALAMGPVPAVAQPLAQYLDSADRQNVDARLEQVSAEQADAEAGQAWGALLPALTANGGWTHNQYPAELDLPTGPTTTQRIVIVPRDQLDATFKVEVPLIDATKWFRAAAAAANTEARAERRQRTRDQIRRQVVAAFYLLAGSHSVLESARASAGVAEAQLEQQTAKRAAGAATELEVVRAKAELERAKQVVADAEAQEANAHRSLHTLSGLEPKSPPALGDDDLRPEAPLAELESRLELLPAVKAAEAEVSVAARNRAAAAAAIAPSVNAQFTERLTNATGFQNQPSLWNGGVTFNWRFDVSGVQGFRVAGAQAQSAVLNAEKARQQARDQIHSDWQRVRAAITKVSAAKSQAEAARRAAALARERNAAGVATQLDVIQSDRDVFAAEVNDIQARFDLASARASLHVSAGLTPQEAK
ncbi:MAG: TolC family protein [Archangium sp.]|nr:TolC family protein [Archangium sp.]